MKISICWVMFNCILLGMLVLSDGLLPAHAAQYSSTPDLAAIDAYVKSQMQSDRIPGLALGIVKGNRIIHLSGFGVADPTGRPVTPQTPFIIGSMSKSFTALAILQLVEEGKVELDAPVQRYIHWFSTADPQASTHITVRYLLNHTSGIPSYAGLKAMGGTGDGTLEQRVRELSTIPLTAPVGTTFQYSNDNYVVLGLIIQMVSGQSYGEYIQQHIFVPLQMHHSFVSQTEAMRDGLATGHLWWFGTPFPANLPYIPDALPASFIISSAENMTHYLIAHMNDGDYSSTSVLDPAGIATLHRPAAVISQTGDHYAMGWVVGSLNGVPVLWHGGDTANFHADMVIVPRDQLGIVVLTNVNNGLIQLEQLGKMGRIIAGVTNLLMGHQPSDAVLSVQMVYFIFDVVVLLLSTLQIWSLVLVLRHWRQPLQQRSLKRLWLVFLPLLWELLLPLGLLLGLLLGLNLFDLTWSVVVLYAPDLSYWLMAMFLLLLATGVTRIVQVFSRIRRTNASTKIDTPLLSEV